MIMRNLINKKRVIIFIICSCLSQNIVAANFTNSNSYINDITKSISNNFTVAVDIYTTSETDALDKVAIEEEKRCAAGEEGTQGEAINEAVKIHIEFGSAQPNVEELFGIESDCFSKLNKLYDLSYSIPSLSTIINAAQEAVLDYSKQKVCTAIFESSRIVTEPLNKAIDKINSKYSKYLNLNGIISDSINNQLSKLDADLGKDYITNNSNKEYNISPFNKDQTTFESNSTPDFNTSKSKDNDKSIYNNQLNQLNSLNNNLQSEQIKLPKAQNSLSSAQNQYNKCLNQSSNCTFYQQKLDQAQSEVNLIQQNIQMYQNQISSLSSKQNTIGSGQINNSVSNSASHSNTVQSDQQRNNDNSGYFHSIKQIFN